MTNFWDNQYQMTHHSAVELAVEAQNITGFKKVLLHKANDFPALINLATLDDSDDWCNPLENEKIQHLQDMNIYHDSTLILVKDADEVAKEMTTVQRRPCKT